MKNSLIHQLQISLLTVLACSSTLLGQTTTTTTTTSGEPAAKSSAASTGSTTNGAGGMSEIGFRYMPTFTSFDITPTNNSTITTSFTVGHGFGAFLAYYLSDNSAIQGELIYSSLSQKYVDNSVENTISLSYINIPLLFSFNSSKSAPLNFNAVIGPQIGINVGSSVKASGNGNGTSTVTGVLAVKAGDIGFAYGVGLDFGTAPWRFGLGFRGVYGLLDISDKSNSTTTDQYYILDRSHVKTYAGYLSVSYLM